MEAALLDESRLLAEELYELIRTLDPATWRQELEDAARTRLLAVRERARALRERLEHLEPATADEAAERFRQALAELVELADARLARLQSESVAEWRQLFRRLQPEYAAIAHRLRAAHVELPALRPTNARRTLLHIQSGLVVMVCVHYVMTPLQCVLTAAFFTVTGWSMEIARWRSPEANDRIMAFWAPVAHGHEWHRVNSATWYCTALVILGLLAAPVTISIAAMVLALADPVAALVGRRFGRVKLVGNRTILGTLAFMVTGVIATFGLLAAFGPPLGLTAMLMVAIAGGTAGAGAELFSQRVDDNLTIPLAVALVIEPMLVWLGPLG